MRLVTGCDDDILAWLRDHFGLYVLQHPRAVFGIVDGGWVAGCFVVTWRSDTTAELSVYGRVSPATFRQMFRTVFEQLGVYRLEIRTHHANAKIRRAAPKFGFTFQGSEKHFYGPNEHAYVYTMTPETCRWLKRYGLPIFISEKA